MSDNQKYVQSQELKLAIGANAGATSIRIRLLKDTDGNVLTMTDFGTVGYGTLEPNTTREEQISWTGITDNSDDTYTLTGVKNVITKAPYTETSGTTKTHVGGSKFIISNNPGLYNTFANKKNDETIENVWTFTVPNYPVVDTPGTEPTTDAQLVPKKYVDDNKIDKDGTLAMAANLDMDSNKIVNVTDPTAAQDAATKAYADALAIAGAPNASETVKGIVEEATAAEVLAGTAVGLTGARLYVNPSTLGLTDVQIFTSDGTWTKPSGTPLTVEVIAIGGGAGGTGGATNRLGGLGGGGGGFVEETFLASVLGANETVTVGIGGAGGASASAGVTGGFSAFGVWLKAFGGVNTGAGGNGMGIGATAVSATNDGNPATLGGASGGGTTATGGAGRVGGAANRFGAAGGASGGGDSQNGGVGGGQTYRSTAIAGGTAGTGNGAGNGGAGGNGTDVSVNELTAGVGGGGGGGAGPTNGTGGAGGNGGKYGAGGGGGGATNGAGTGGAGGNGADGIVIVITYY